ncbi:MAG: single-stranded DNA-binding protein [Bacteroidota bacterium]|nr:single-stranded DNA-binding protein [Bacteroidota bacterium]
MNALRNTVQLIGHLGKDPEVTSLEKGKKLARVSMATNEYYTTAKGEKTSRTEWHNLVAWDGKAEFLEKYLKKGQEVAIQGKLTHRSYEDKTGITRYVTEVVVQEILRLGSKES